MEKVATKSLAACIYQTEIKTPRIRNFQKVARHQGEKFEGIYYDDSDVYKALEAIAYSLRTRKDSTLEATAERWVDIIAAAQLPDGYLDTYFTLTDLSRRWTELEKHEDYCAGHLIEAAVAYFDATGKRKLLDVAIRLANHIDSTFRMQNKQWFSGHEEIELALMKLYHTTGNERYLKLANWYLEQRGHRYYSYGKNWATPEYWQDVLPVKEQTRITGHAVRAMYLYSGAADVAAATGDTGYVRAMKAVWDDVVDRNMYLTGGIGSTGDNEGFTKDYDLPNEQAYCETCASVGMVFWNERMSELTGEAQYVDVLERSLYNAALDGLSLTGDRFFYDNPLASNGQHQRQEWFGTACCPANISRLVASLGNYVYGTDAASVWVNLFVGSETRVNIGGAEIELAMETAYPYDGHVTIRVDPAQRSTFGLRLRIPGWAMGKPVPGDIYRYVNFHPGEIGLTVNGKKIPIRDERGYAVIERKWSKGDVVEYEIPMQVNRVEATEKIAADRDRVAIERGPLVYCVEGSDNGARAWNFTIPASVQFTQKPDTVAGEPVLALDADVNAAVVSADGQRVEMTTRMITAIPYYAWANRGPNEMQVWLPTRIKDVKIND